MLWAHTVRHVLFPGSSFTRISSPRRALAGAPALTNSGPLGRGCCAIRQLRQIITCAAPHHHQSSPTRKVTSHCWRPRCIPAAETVLRHVTKNSKAHMLCCLPLCIARGTTSRRMQHIALSDFQSRQQLLQFAGVSGHTDSDNPSTVDETEIPATLSQAAVRQ